MESPPCVVASRFNVPAPLLRITSTFAYLRLSKAFDNRKDRYTLFSPRLQEELRVYWRAFRPASWLFPSSREAREPMPEGTGQKIFWNAVDRAGLPRKGGIHSLRHSFATHLLEAGVEITVVQRLLGHSSLSTTATCLHVRQERLAQIAGPLQLLDLGTIA